MIKIEIEKNKNELKKGLKKEIKLENQLKNMQKKAKNLTRIKVKQIKNMIK